MPHKKSTPFLAKPGKEPPTLRIAESHYKDLLAVRVFGELLLKELLENHPEVAAQKVVRDFVQVVQDSYSPSDTARVFFGCS